MSFIDRRDENRPATGEVPFRLNEVFFSRTDARGVIAAANYLFRRVAGFEWEEMLGAPHKIIRHPDMPKAVFWLLWNTIQSGKPIGAYVKNRAKDGLYYWVFAVVMPCPGGYLSVRIKPSSTVFDLVKDEYATLLKAEQEQGGSPEESAKLLLSRLRELGFDSYASFASHALCEELIARDQGLENQPDATITKFRRLLDEAKTLKDETTGLVGDFATMRTIPNNMRVIASRLEPTGGPVSTLSKNYSSSSQETSDWFEKYVVGQDSNFSTIKDTIETCLFLECMARILTEAVSQLNAERRWLGKVDMAGERALLNTLRTDYVDLSASGQAQVTDEAERILKACKNMHRQMLGLSTTRVMCKIERARLASDGGALDDIITQLDMFQTRIVSRLNNISRHADAIYS